MNPGAIPAAVCTALAVWCFVASIRPWRRLGPRIHLYTVGVRTRQGATREQAVLGLLSPPPTPATIVSRVFGPLVEALVRRTSSIIGRQGEEELALSLAQAGLHDVTPRTYLYQQFSYALLGLVGGAFLGVLFGMRAGLVFAVLGTLWGSMLKRAELARRIRERCDRIRAELLTVCLVLAAQIRATPNLQAVVANIVERSRGEVAGELRQVLSAIRGGTPPEVAFGQAAARTPEPAARDFYEALATALVVGGDLAETMRAQASKIREAQREARRTTATRKKLASVSTTVLFMGIPMVILVAAPSIHIVLNNN